MKRFIFSCLILLLVIPSNASALVGNDFTIKVAIGNDVTPPSTPTLQSVTPIAPTQIDLTWSTSTDNWILGGYVVLRDNNPIATTTLTNYNDTGLTAETLYTYEVYAFDSMGNISSTSNALATTTLAIPIVATTTPVTNQIGASGSKVLILQDLKIEAKTNSATLIWETNRPARYILRWGRTDLYTGGYIENESYRTTQQTTITDLEPGTVYLYELIGFTPAGVAITLKTGQFTTKEETKDRVVQNVERLTATVTGNDVRLDYQLPDSEPGAKVRILRSYLGFPTDIYDGAIVYEGTKNSIYDKSALLDNERQYYTVFVIGADGTISSGAVVVANRQRMGEGVDAEGETKPPLGTSSKPDILLPLLTLEQIVIKQNNKQQTFFDEALTLSYLEPFTISIAKETLPDHLKSIVITLLDPTDGRRSYSFLLRINKAGTAYEATISALRVMGTSRLTVEVFDFEQLVVGRYHKQIDFIAPERLKEAVFFPDTVVMILGKVWPGLAVLFGLFIIWWIFFWRRREEAEDKQ